MPPKMSLTQSPRLQSLSLSGILILATLLAATGCKQTETALTAKEARDTAKYAYIYGFPMGANYQTLYKQAVDTTSPDYRAPFNTLSNASNVATPDDKFVVTPNSDTPYSYLWMDLRAEPIIVTMPRIEPNRYYTGQMVDLYTYNFAYLGTRAYGNDGGYFLIAGPDWSSGINPPGIKAVFHSQTQFAYLLIRTQLFNAADIDKRPQDSVRLQRPDPQRLPPSARPNPRPACRHLAQTLRRHAHHPRHLSLPQLPPPVLPRRPIRTRAHAPFRPHQHRRWQKL